MVVHVEMIIFRVFLGWNVVVVRVGGMPEYGDRMLCYSGSLIVFFRRRHFKVPHPSGLCRKRNEQPDYIGIPSERASDGVWMGRGVAASVDAKRIALR